MAAAGILRRMSAGLVLNTSFLVLLHLSKASLQWRAITDGVIPTDLSPVGVGITWVGRYSSTAAQATFSGKYYNWTEARFKSSYLNIPYIENDFEGLEYTGVPDAQLTWVPAEVHVVTEGAVRGGYVADGSPLYVVNVYTSYNSLGNYDPRQSCAEHYYNGIAQCSSGWTMLSLQFDNPLELRVSSYTSPQMILDSASTVSSIPNAIFLLDRNTSSCIPTFEDRKRLFQAVFYLPTLDYTDKSTAMFDVFTKGRAGCGALYWTFFVEEQCMPSSFKECAITSERREEHNTVCQVQCRCIMRSCEYLHMRYNYIAWEPDTDTLICEVGRIYDVNPL